MGVPLTFLDKHNPEQFEIVGVTQAWTGWRLQDVPAGTGWSRLERGSNVTKLNDGSGIEAGPPQQTTYYMVGKGLTIVKLYARILIKRKRYAMKIELKEIPVRELTDGYADKLRLELSATAVDWTSDRRTRGSSSTRINSGMRSLTLSLRTSH